MLPFLRYFRESSDIQLTDLVDRFIKPCDRLPLSLKVLGALVGRKIHVTAYHDKYVGRNTAKEKWMLRSRLQQTINNTV